MKLDRLEPGGHRIFFWTLDLENNGLDTPRLHSSDIDEQLLFWIGS